MSELKQIGWPEAVAYRMANALHEMGVLGYNTRADQEAQIKLADILRLYCLPRPAEPEPLAPKPFKAVYHRYGDLRMAEFSDYEQARDFLQQSASAGELHGQGIYDAQRGVAYYPIETEDPVVIDPGHEKQLMKALALETPPPAAGLYPTFPGYAQEE